MDRRGENMMDEMLSNPGPPHTPLSATEPTEHAPEDCSTSPQGKSSHGEPKGQFVKIDGSVGGSGYDETTVDVIAVPCPGADPLETWSRDALVENYFGAPSMRSSTRTSDLRAGQTSGGTGESGKGYGTTAAYKIGSPSWVRLGVRKEASKARVLMYEHREIREGTTLNVLAEDLLREVLEIRLMQDGSRPIYFISHSIGGLVVKLALGKASRNPLYESILHDCYGVVFFATPHRGSNYLSMPEISSSIQALLGLATPLPCSITDQLRVGHPLLLHLEEEFRVLASDLQVWTFYETIESRLSGEAASRPGEVYFTAPITALKSAILGIRQETIYPLQSDHANCASFGRNNAQTMKVFLKHLARSIAKADRNGKDKSHTPMSLEEKVPVEVHGFYEDAVAITSAETLTTIRTWSTRVPLTEYLIKGPVECLSDRLNEVNDGPADSQFMAARRRTSKLKEENLPSPPPLELGSNLLGIGEPRGGNRRANSETALPMDDAGDADAGNYLHPASTATPTAPNTSPNPDAATARERRQEGHENVRHRSSSDTRAPRTEEKSLVESPRSRRRVALTRRFTDQFSPRWSGPLEKTFFQGLPFSPSSPFDLEGEQIPGAEPYVPVFAKPDSSNRRYIWTHLPFTNPAWVKKIFEMLEVKEGRDLSDVYNHGQWYSKHTRGRHSQHYAYFVKPACGWIPPAPRSPLTPHSSLVASSEPIIYLFIPFLHFDSYKKLLRRRSLIQRRLRQGRARPVPQNVARLQSLELQVIWEYLGYDPPVNCRRTLDQYGYPSLHDTRPRDDDQMLYKMTKERIALSDQVGADTYDNPGDGQHRTRRETSSAGSKAHADEYECSEEGETPVNEEDVLEGNVLMVDQLWMWAVGPNTLLTFFSRRESDATEGPLYQQADLRDSIFNDVNSDVTRQCESALDMAGLIALHAVTVLMDRTSHPDLEVFRIFEEAISILTEKMTSSLKDFRTQHLRPPPALASPDTKPRTAHARHAHEAEVAAHENRDSTSALLELRDIEDELATLLSLFDKQEKMLNTMRGLYRRHARAETGASYIAEALGRLVEYKQRTAEMIRRVRATRDDYDKLLQMVQRQAQVDEVRLQRLQADVASSQSRSVMIFTVFTVIFLPLSFFTSLFGMNTREWDDEKMPSIRTICLVSLPASAFLIGLALVMAWSTRVRTFLRGVVSVHRRVTGLLSEAVERLGAMVPRAEEARKAREEGAKRRATERRRRRRLAKEGSAGSGDFWERHRLEREYSYRIPVANRKGMVTGGK